MCCNPLNPQPPAPPEPVIGIMSYYFLFSGNASGLSFAGPWNGAVQSNEPFAQVIIPRDGVLRRLRVRCVAGALSGGVATTFTARVNAANTALAFAMTSGTSIGSDLVNEIPVTAGQLLSIGVSGPGGATAPANTRIFVELDPP